MKQHPQISQIPQIMNTKNAAICHFFSFKTQSLNLRNLRNLRMDGFLLSLFPCEYRGATSKSTGFETKPGVKKPMQELIEQLKAFEARVSHARQYL